MKLTSSEPLALPTPQNLKKRRNQNFLFLSPTLSYMSLEGGTDYHGRPHGTATPNTSLKREQPINYRDPTTLSVSSSSIVQSQKQSQSQSQVSSVSKPFLDQLPFIPNELIEEILSRLPVTSLLQLRCVCKSWKSLISDPYFIRKHLLSSTQDTSLNHQRIMLSSTTAEFNLKSCAVCSLIDEPSIISEELNYPVKNKFRHDGIVGSCNGLLCFAIKAERVLLWNPSIRVSKKSPSLDNNWRPGCYTAFGLGYDHISDDYKVVAVFCDPGEQHHISKTSAKVYSLATNSWRKIQDFPNGFTPYHDFGKFVSGTLNWPARCSFGSRSVNSTPDPLWVIVSFDLQKETYRQVLPPAYEKEVSSRPSLGVLGGCLSMSYDYKKTHFVVWIMKDHGVRESWVRLVTIPYLPNPEDFSYSQPFCVSENGQILLMFEFDLVLYDTRDKSFKYPRIENGKGWFDAEVYIESLVSPLNSHANGFNVQVLPFSDLHVTEKAVSDKLLS
ncbi:F-box/kelch-repeat protein At3g23880-like [Neltuma alba]|uniref:F-box/kelch-repeat protein At3g23880-like n=1 Tax=Neltuma alba TaxID=207710 RepID=UPI0010A3B5AD|nr:F-box/kelch-repeat protein At3g23880-like [Prosopis alba]